MPHGEEFSNSLLVKVDGTPLPDDVATQLVSGSIDDSTRVPDLFVLRFTDPGGTVLAKAGFDIGAQVELGLQSTAPGGPEPLLVGEVTALEAEVGEGGVHTVVRGLDLAHRLYRGTRVKAYVNMAASDIVAEVARRVGLPVVVDATPAMLDHTTQAGESDWDFLSRLAAQHDRLLTVSDGRLHFVRRPAAAEAPTSTDARSEPLVLEQGVNLVQLRATITASGQVPAVQVRGWDPAQQQPVVADAECRTDSARPDGGTSPRQVAERFTSPPYVSGDPRLSDTEIARASAASLADHVAGGFAEVEGVARGNPALRAGSAIKLAGVGDPFAGRYVLTSTRHEFSPAVGYRTQFVASNTSDRSLYAATGAATGPDAGTVGVSPAVVTSVQDPEDLGRVKIKVPWLSDDYESGWARTLQLGAGDERGLTILPEVGDEVLVAYAAGDLGHPYVLGGVFNGRDRPRPGWGEHVDGGSGAVSRRAWVSRTGMEVAFVERSGAESLEITTNGGAQKVVLQQSAKGIEIVSEGPVDVTARQNATVRAQGDVAVEAQGNAGVKGTRVEVTSSAGLKLSGATVDVEASGPLTLKGAIVRIN
ncbi:VgrG-related protein [Nocardioides humi]|uniref:VgrG-related protein n=1 Tax=Nocardioides humi TaxID=449461 RepID=A0ABN2B1P4_9ACTN|nr:VgrG-related protein [Nocardioides humi]